MNPKIIYLNNIPDLSNGEEIRGSARILELNGRRGINPTSIHTSIKLGHHNLNDPKGAVALWFFPLEDLACSFIADHMRIDNSHFANYAFLSDCETPRDYGNSNFFFGWFRFNELRVQFFKGNMHPTAFDPPEKAWVHAVPFNYFIKHQWYQLAFTWDEPEKDMSLYVNGVLVGKSDRFNPDFYRDRVSDVLYAGCPAICHGEIQFFDQVFSQDQIYERYRETVTDYNPVVEKQLRHHFCGADLEEFSFNPDGNWTKQFDIDFSKPEDIEEFYIQGVEEAIKPDVHPDGLLIETPDIPFRRCNTDQQVYIWSNKTFEGNIYIEYEWQTLKPEGLSLLMWHASGMSREDFMVDYPQKTSGKMTTVHGENVRNYHWEYYREMNDVRNDVGTAFSRKNPFAFRNGFASSNKPFARNQWHKLQLLCINGKVSGAIDGKILLEFEDNSRSNTGCILNYGHIAIRCMLHTKMLFRNLKVFTEQPPFTEKPF